MSSSEPASPTLRSIFLGICLAILLLLMLCRIGDLVKFAGVGLLWVPQQLGLVDRVEPGQVEMFDLSQKDNTWQVVEPGFYSVYTANDNLLELSPALEAGGKTWLTVRAEDGAEIPVSPVRRGLSLVDTPLAPGRPVYTLAVAEAGLYALVHPHQPAQIALVPDIVSGHEVRILLVFGAEALVVGGVIAWLYYRRRRARQQRLAKWRPRDVV